MSDGALIRAKIVSLRPLNKDKPTRDDGSPTPAIATIQTEVTIKKSDDITFLNSNEFDSANDLASGFARVEPNKEDPSHFHLEFGGLRKFVPKATT